MRTSLTLILLAVFCTPCLADMEVVVIGQPTGSPCVTAGCSGTYMACYTGAYAGDTDKMCINSGASTADGTANNGASFGAVTGGGNGCITAGADDNCSWPITAGDIFSSSEGTVYLDIRFAANTADTYFWGASYNTDNRIRAYRKFSNSTIHLEHTGNNVDVANQSADTVNIETWYTIGLAWSVASNQTSIKIGAGDWTNDVDADAVTAFTSEPTVMLVGWTSACIDVIEVKNVYSLAGYKTAHP